VTSQYAHTRFGRAFQRLLSLLLGGLVAVALAACDTSSGSGGPSLPAPDKLSGIGGLNYRLGVGDKVKVVVLGQSDLGGDLEVDAGGKIVVALVGEVVALNRTVAEVQEDIRAKFAQGVLRDPKVTVQVVGYRPVTVLGQVRQPGRYPFSSDLNVRGAAAMAGGYERRGSTDAAIIFRAGKKYDANAETQLLPGDTVEIPRKFF